MSIYLKNTVPWNNSIKVYVLSRQFNPFYIKDAESPCLAPNAEWATKLFFISTTVPLHVRVIVRSWPASAVGVCEVQRRGQRSESAAVSVFPVQFSDDIAVLNPTFSTGCTYTHDEDYCLHYLNVAGRSKSFSTDQDCRGLECCAFICPPAVLPDVARAGEPIESRTPRDSGLP